MTDKYIRNFFKELNENNYIQNRKDGWLNITASSIKQCITFNSEIKIPDRVRFRCYNGHILFNDLKELPNNVEFKTNSNMQLVGEYKVIPKGVKFNSKGSLWLGYGLEYQKRSQLEIISEGSEFDVETLFLLGCPLKELPHDADLWFDKLDKESRIYIERRFPDHLIFKRRKFGL